MELDVTVNAQRFVTVEEKRTVTLPFTIEADSEGKSFIDFENGKYYDVNKFHRENEPFSKQEITEDHAREIIKAVLDVPPEERFLMRRNFERRARA